MPSDPIYAIGDIHGHLDQLDHALALIEKDGGPDAQVVFLGDLVDRGPDSCGVIERLQRGIAAGRNWTVLKGNHDAMFQAFLEEAELFHPRTRLGLSYLDSTIGGSATLASYGSDMRLTDPEDLRRDALEHIPYRHLEFIRQLPLYHQVADLLFVHAGIRPEVALADQDPEDLYWIRAEFLEHPDPHPWLVVHGHTAVQRAEHHGNRVNLDSGAGFGRPITAAVIAGRNVWELGPFGRQPLLPLD
ncbi:Bis(5'-nucleosyl)-tetraphosphatase PrpE [asymmetrical] [Thalassovita autumnalis]|uniref:Bis(5'-nucleosyl)-tetraphosphatase PrpE [asymmetrical] n=1 Tax=Thalassovita autumnalis TaxID=2072972 RepID=A0A0P1FZ57_9RHOB|nr:metallophosphoesterase family protein [Thalassovita autumnalis]CUH69390.1 Bis(5'-nucleosyl)-tetraphosphatase PrpE [asymmetrical] [Thalassovita autumnalis]CUH74313.1 Bis(5'-nucleosyl)-tetraphosphatase PrpE [asymmetrical] [Thalassovita autumnalis]